jgi:hypothetical protein
LTTTSQRRAIWTKRHLQTRPQLSEADLELMLQVQAFAKAAIWYEQASKGGNSGATAFDNFGRILPRSPRRVEQGMDTAP